MSKKRSKANAKAVKKQLFLKCGRVDMYNMEKYKEHPECIKKGVVLPVPSNQRMNSYLKEIADVCGIKKTLSTHIARHTVACVAIANKVSMESIAKMLGHTDIRTTKIYARLMDRTVSEEMNVLRQKFSV